jgi:outer membrane protein assembly factor BamA
VIGDYDLPGGSVSNPLPVLDGNILPLGEIDTNLKLPLSERYFLGGLGEYQLRGFEARSVGPRRAILYAVTTDQGSDYIPVGRVPIHVDENGDVIPIENWGDPNNPYEAVATVCNDGPGTGGNGNFECNDIGDTRTKDFEDLEETDVVGGNKFISSTFEYRFPISETIGLQGVVFFDTGNAFAEDENLFDVTEWRYGTGVGVQWFSPFGPLAVVIGFPLDRLSSVEDMPVFEFSVGGQGF